MEDEPRARERVKEVAPDPKKLSPSQLVKRSIELISELKGRELEELQGETPHIRAALSELNHLVGIIATHIRAALSELNHLVGIIARIKSAK